MAGTERHLAFSSDSNQLALVLHGVNDLRIESNSKSVPRPTEADLGSRDVLVAPQSVGICGTDIHFLTHGEVGPYKVRAPMVPGHETSAKVLAVGAEVKTLKPGDRVAVEVGIPCRTCRLCRGGRYNLCPKQDFGSLPPCHGSLRPAGVYPEDFCYKIPDHMSYDEAACVEPLAVGVQAVKRGGVKLGDTVLITGAGPIGLMCLFVAKAAGATTVILTDVKDDRLLFAQELGATLTINSSKEQVEQVLQQHGWIVDVSIDCTGNEIAIAACLDNTKPGGVVVVVGLGPAKMTLPVTSAFTRELDIRGVFKYNDAYQPAINLIASGKVNVKPIITHHYDLKDSLEGFKVSQNGIDRSGKMAVKVMLHVGNAGQWHQE